MGDEAGEGMSVPAGGEPEHYRGAVSVDGGAGRPASPRQRPIGLLLVVVAALCAALVVWAGSGERAGSPPLEDASPGFQAGHLMAFDPVSSRTLLLTVGHPRDLWAFDAAELRWELATAGSGAGSVPAMAYDVESHLLVVVGSDWVDEATTVRVFDPATDTWSDRAEAPEYRDDWWSKGWLQGAYDAGSDRFVLATDWGAFWSYDVDADHWSEGLNPWTGAPSVLLRELHAEPPPCLGWNRERPMAYDAGSDRIVVAGRGDLCLYDTDDGTLTVRRSGDAPRWVAALTYHGRARVVVILGDGWVWTYDVTSDRLQRVGSVAAGLRWGEAAMAYDDEAASIVAYDGSTTWLYDLDGDTWTRVQP